ncbi:MAG: DUF1679 domain-containing protein [Thermodesulfobacteriales bacterium]|nr:MAG: DUF1679 domain-containing protein [Thermodesulfobacteriales bacterium]
MPIKDPMHVDEITSEWITHALKEGGYLKNASVKSIEKKVIGDATGFLSSVVQVKIEYDLEEKDAPASVVVKIEPEEGGFKDFGDELNAFQREIHFYRDVAANLSIRLPELYYAVDKPPAFSMVMEDLSSYIPGDQVVGMHEQQVMTTVEEIARIQAQYWNNEALEKLTWMPDTNSMGDDYADKWESFVEHYGYCLDDKGRELCGKLARFIDWKKAEIQKRQKTIVHSDLREDNLLFPPSGSNDSILIIDWQLAVRNIGAFDVARLMGGSELPKERKGHQFEVLKRWHYTLIEHGVTNYPWEDAVYDFRLGTLSFLCYPVHLHQEIIGVQGRAKLLAEAIFTRSFATAVEIEAGSILPE